MWPKNLSKRALSTAALSGFILSAALISYFPSKNLTNNNSALLVENATTTPNQELERSGLPLRIKIPSIEVDAPFEYVGLTSDGAMDIPKGPNEVAWLNLGPRPGENGSAVIAGHYGWKNNIPAVFDNLHKLSEGDRITVEDEKGVITTFVVREMRTYGRDEAAPDVFFSNDGKAHLNLITCTGAWNKQTSQYPERLVVFTDKE